MDCPSEENLIRLKLDGISFIQKLDFDLQARTLTVFHSEENSKIEEYLDELKLGSKLIKSSIENNDKINENPFIQSKLLWSVLIINFSFFIIEISTGFFYRSMGLIADSLDMLADSFVYAISLFAVSGSLLQKKKIAKFAGYIQIVLAVIGFVEIIRRFLSHEQMPNFSVMIIVALLALIANAFSLYLLQKSKSKEPHMKASMIFTSNDVVVNLGVIFAGILVYLTKSAIPDLTIGILVFIFVFRGALRILKLK